jgi:hypothetical protein
MSEGIIAWACPGCGQPIEPADDYVVAREYSLPPDFTLHMKGHDDVGTTRRFHVEHFAVGWATTSGDRRAAFALARCLSVTAFG